MMKNKLLFYFCSLFFDAFCFFLLEAERLLDRELEFEFFVGDPDRFFSFLLW